MTENSLQLIRCIGMNSNLTPTENALLQQAGEHIKNLPQVDIQTEQFLHAGCYVRTCLVPKGVAIESALIKIPTTVIISGDCLIFDGKARQQITGYRIIKANAPRRAVWLAVEDTFITMFFATKNTTLEECEKEFTDEYQLLQTRAEQCRA